MSFNLYELTADSKDIIEEYSYLRQMNTCEGQFISQFIWSDFYKTKFCKTDKYIFFVLNISNEYASCMPLCKLEDIEETFLDMEKFYNEELKAHLKIYLADEIFLNQLNKSDYFQNNYNSFEVREYFDYIYDAEKLKTLSGKKYHKKKNHLNAFLKENEGHYEYRNLSCSSTEDVKNFFDTWKENKENNDSLNRLDDEAKGIYKVLNNCNKLNAKIGGVYIDNKLEAFTIGSYNEKMKRAFIHIEKANPNIRGLYNYINQQFLINSFPEATTVNREDDMGIDGLRQAKLSYNPIELVKKFNIFQK